MDTMRERLSVAAVLADLPDWQAVPEREAIHRRYMFRSFNHAMGFMFRVALQAEKLDHHPEWSNVYQRVDVVLSTHDVQGVSARDVELARFMDRVAAELQ